MRFVGWNVNGLRACVKKGFVESMKALEPDVICLQETRLSAGQEPQELEAFSDYQMVWHAAQKKGYSGVSVWSKRPMENVRYDFSDKYGVEGRTLLVDIGDVTLINGYFPNGGASPERLQYKLDYYADLLACICRLRAAGRKVVVTGDLNTSHLEIDIARPKQNRKKSGFMPVECDWITRYLDAGFVDTFRMFDQMPARYTWWSQRWGIREKNIGWRLDYFLATEDLRDRITGADIHSDVMGSDHCPVSLDLSL